MLETATDFVTSSEDEHALKQAIALDGLLLDLKDCDQGVRLAKAVEQAADALERQLREDREATENLPFADMLRSLKSLLRDADA